MISQPTVGAVSNPLKSMFYVLKRYGWSSPTQPPLYEAVPYNLLLPAEFQLAAGESEEDFRERMRDWLAEMLWLVDEAFRRVYRDFGET